MDVVLPVAEVAFHPFTTTFPFVGIHRKPDSMLLNLYGAWATISQREEPSGLWHDLYNGHQQPLHVLWQGFFLAKTLVHIYIISHHGPSCRNG